MVFMHYGRMTFQEFFSFSFAESCLGKKLDRELLNTYPVSLDFSLAVIFIRVVFSFIYGNTCSFASPTCLIIRLQIHISIVCSLSPSVFPDVHDSQPCQYTPNKLYKYTLQIIFYFNTAMVVLSYFRFETLALPDVNRKLCFLSSGTLCTCSSRHVTV